MCTLDWPAPGLNIDASFRARVDDGSCTHVHPSRPRPTRAIARRLTRSIVLSSPSCTGLSAISRVARLWKWQR